MNGTFYYLAAYTAAVAAGFPQKHGIEFARATRYTEDYIEARLSSQGMAKGPSERGFWSALHYLPGDPKKTSGEANPAFVEATGPELVLELPLVCRPGGELIPEIVERMRRQWNPEYACTPMWQSIGISLHALGSSFLHEGFAGVSGKIVNEAAGILRAGRVLPEKLREILPQSAQVPLETLLDLEPYAPEPVPDSFLGCGQLGGLMDSPNQIFAYQSPWRTVPAVSVLNPVRFACAYLAMKNALIYVRAEKALSTPDQLLTCSDLTDLACFFNGISKDEDLDGPWKRDFACCHGLSQEYEAPDYDTDRNYINSFDAQALSYRDFIWDICPPLFLWMESVSLPRQQAAPKIGA